MSSTSSFYFRFSIPFIILALYCLSLLAVTQIRGHIAGSFPPLPTESLYTASTGSMSSIYPRVQAVPAVQNF